MSEHIAEVIPALIDTLLSATTASSDDDRISVELDPAQLKIVAIHTSLLLRDGKAEIEKRAIATEDQELLAKLNHLGSALDTFRTPIIVVMSRTTAPPPDMPRDVDNYLTGNAFFEAGFDLITSSEGEFDDNLDHAIAHFEAAAMWLQRSVPAAWAMVQYNLGRAFSDRRRGDKGANEDRGIAHYEAALTVWSREDHTEDWADTHANLGAFYGHRVRGNRNSNLERAVGHFELALSVSASSYDPSVWQRRILDYANFRFRLQTGNRPAHQEAAARCFLSILDQVSPETDPLLWGDALHGLGTCFNERLVGPRAENAERSVACFKAALSVRSQAEDEERWLATLNNLGNTYVLQADLGEAGAADRAIRCFEDVLDAASRRNDVRQWVATMENISNAWAARDQGDRADNLETAITCVERALEAYPLELGPTGRAGCLYSLGNLYRDRLRGDRAENLEFAHANLAAALKLRRGSGNREEWAENLLAISNVMWQRLRGSRPENIERAIDLAGQALDVIDEQSYPNLWGTIKNLLGVLYRDRIRGDPAENVDRAIAHHLDALRVRTFTSSPTRWAISKNNLAAAYRIRLNGKRADNIEEAIKAYQAAATVWNEHSHPSEWAMLQMNLANAFYERPDGDARSNKQTALAGFLAAIPTLKVRDPARALAVQIAAGWCHWFLDDTDAAYASWQEALSWRETLLVNGTTQETRGEAALFAGDLPVLLAMIEVSRGELVRAVETLERGRALALREALSLDDIWLDDASEASRLAIRDARAALSAVREQAAIGAPDRIRSIRDWDSRIEQAQAALADALERARESAGFIPPSPLDFAELAELSPPGGAIVIFAAGVESGVAFVVTSHGEASVSPVAVQLPDASDAALQHLVADWADVYALQLEAHDDGPKILAHINSALEVLLSELWNAVIEPVVRCMSAIGLEDRAPLVLMPQGVLSLLPLHAAGYVADGSLRTLLDSRIVSYAPSGFSLRTVEQRLRGYRMSRRSSDENGSPTHLFGTFNPGKGGPSSLDAAEEIELPCLQALFSLAGRSAQCCVGQPSLGHPEPTATLEHVLAGVASADYVHFACHGYFDSWRPEHSGLHLADGEMLTQSMIVGRLRLDQCRLVTLSACETAMVDVARLPDEFIGLPSAFLQAGACGVIGTLWSVFDEPTAALMGRIYQLHLGDDALTPAAALREAVLEARDGRLGLCGADGRRLASMPLSWAAFVHYGI